MKTLYIECNMGAAGDMLMASLSELLPNPQEFVDVMNALNLPGVAVSREKSVKCGITGSHITVKVHGEEEESHDHGHEHEHEHHHEDDHDHEHHHDHDHDHEHHHDHDQDHHDHDHHHDHGHGHHHHAGLGEIEAIIGALPVSDRVKHDALHVYGLIAEAEAKAHDRPVTEVHFHEVGAMDAVADVVGVCLLMEHLNPDRVIVSPVHVGSGHVRCAHGILPVPAPATAHILKGVPIYGGSIKGELCTPTGAALVKYFADGFGAMPVMSVEAIGYGMGKKDFEAANCVRTYWGESF